MSDQRDPDDRFGKSRSDAERYVRDTDGEEPEEASDTQVGRSGMGRGEKPRKSRSREKR